MVFLGLDVGLSSVKAGIFDETGERLLIAEKPNSSVVTAGNKFEIVPATLWCIVLDLITTLRQKMGNNWRIDAIGLSGHGNGVYLVDTKSGSASAISPMDARATAIISRWRVDGRAKRISELVGGEVWPGQPLAILAHFGLPSNSKILFVKDWLRYCLTGEFITDPGDASAAGLTVLGTNKWANEAFELAGCNLSSALPELAVGSQSQAGSVSPLAAKQTGIAAATPVFAGSIDLAMGAYGDELCDKTTLHITAGTWTINQLRTADTHRPEGILQTIRSPWPDEMLLVESSPTAAINLNILAERIGNKDYAMWEAAGVTKISQADGIYLPYPIGSWDLPAVKELFSGGKPEGTQKEISLVYEGTALGVTRQVNKFRQAGQEIRKIMLTGGMGNSKVWLKMLTDATQLTIEVANDPHAALRGAAKCAAVGMCGSFAKLSVNRTIITPDKDKADHWRKRYNQFIELLMEHKNGS